MQSAAHILIVDNANLTQRILQKGLSSCFVLTMVENCALAKLNILRSHFDLIVINYDSIGDDAYALCTTLRTECPVEPYCSVVLMSTSICDDFIYRSIQHGVNICMPRALPITQINAFLLRLSHHPCTQLTFRDNCTCNCMAWNYGNIYYQFSPDLQETVVGSSAEEAEELMQALLSEHKDMLAKSQFGQAQAQVVRHRIALK